MTLSRALSSAHSGLVSTSFRAEISAGNIANANTPGYVRREAITTEHTIGGRGNGVRVAGVSRDVDPGLMRLRRESDASVARSSLLAQTYNQLNTELGTPDQDVGLFASLSNLESVIKEFAATPESPALQNGMLQAGRELINQFNALSNYTSVLRENADRNIGKAVETVNTALHDLHNLNRDFAGLDSNSAEAASLEDQRQGLIDTISEIIPVRELPQDDGRIELITTTGIILVSGVVQELSFTPANSIPPTVSYNDGSNVLSGLAVGDQNLTPASGGNFALTSGTLAGYFSIRDNIVPTFSTQLDTLAGDLITRFSDDTLDTSKAPGAPGLFTDNGNAFDPLNLEGVAGRLSLNAAVDPSQGGTLTRLRDGIGATAEGPVGNSDLINGYLDKLNDPSGAPTGTGLTGTHTFSELLAGVTSLVGENRVRHDALNASAASRNTLLSDAEIQKSGVNTDFEMQTLLLVEQAYAANARVIQTVSDMFDRLLAI